ncbi:MAG: class II fructose-bisphosphate aldolase [Dehalococcoidia bacterium]
MDSNWTSIDRVNQDVRGVLRRAGEDGLTVLDEVALRERLIEPLVYGAVLGRDAVLRDICRWLIRKAARAVGVFPASIYELYVARGQGGWRGPTVPAINARGLTYDMARAAFRAARQIEAGAFILEIARSEIGYTQQPPAEYAAAVLGAAIREGYRGPVFLQGDHYQVSRSRFQQEPQAEIQALRSLIAESIQAGFFNIDIDASTLVDLSRSSPEAQQEPNYTVTAELSDAIREHQPTGVTISIGAEIGEVGGRNSTVEDLDAFMSGYLRSTGVQGVSTGITKMSVQTGTSHGGVLLPDGSMAQVSLDFHTLQRLSEVARERYGMAGAVQHGASTLPDELFHRFPQVETAEIHLATGFQNTVYDSPHFPSGLREEIYAYVREAYGAGKLPEETDAQLLYRERKRAWGPFKGKTWDIPEPNRSRIGGELEARFTFLFAQLGIAHTRELVDRYIRPVAAPVPMPAQLKKGW